MYSKIAEENHAKASSAAQAMGISLAAYIDLVLERERVDATGRPVWAPAEKLTFDELRQLGEVRQVS